MQLSVVAVTRKQLFLALTLAGAMLGLMPSASAQMFGGRPVTFIVPVPPGSITDATARHYAGRLQAALGRPVVVENRPGGNHFIAAKAVLSAPADGDTVLIATTSTLTTNVALFKRLPYDPVADFTPLTLLSRLPSVLITAPGKYTSVADLIAAAKKSPDALNYASGAASYQLMCELFNEMAGVRTVNIPYKGAADALTAVLGKQVDFTILDTSTALGAIRSGRIQGGLVASETRLAALPSVPTSAEVGLQGFLATTWVAALVSSKTPKAVSDQLAAKLTAIAEDPATKDFLALQGAEISTPGPDNLRQLQKTDTDLWKRVAVSAKIEQQ